MSLYRKLIMTFYTKYDFELYQKELEFFGTNIYKKFNPMEFNFYFLGNSRKKVYGFMKLKDAFNFIEKFMKKNK